jgi:pimeloyl-ACP methyl ester carboxylesterase
MLLPLATPALGQGPPVDETLLPYIGTADFVKLPDGRELHLVCMGQGSPTVIFTAGAEGWSGAWSHVQPAMARTTRTCAWDRPGFGLSDGTAARPTVATTAADLEAALAAAGIAPPYVMVGHSLGAYETLLFTDRRGHDVAGMVLVDPSFPDQVARAQRIAAATPDPESPPPPGPAVHWRQCAQAVRNGTLRAEGPDPSGCLAFLPPFFPPAVRAAVAAKVTSDPVQFETIAAFTATGLADGSAIVINPARNYGDMPLTVLTATAWPAGAPREPAAARAFVEAAMADSDRAHDELAALSTRGINARVPGAGHDIHVDKPPVVIDAIEAVVRRVRAGSGH